MTRHTYQSNSGGKIQVPLEIGARIIGRTSTPRLSQMVSWKYSQMSANLVSEDLKLNHGRSISSKLIQKIGKAVGEIAMNQESEWVYQLPAMKEVVTHIAIGRDGTTTAIRKQGYRETMCGTLSFYNSKGGRLHTIYLACAPEYGKSSFDAVMDMEIARIKPKYPKITYIGLADGAKTNWTYLDKHTSVNILDFFHATEYLADVSDLIEKDETKRKTWLANACHDLKHKTKGAAHLLREFKHFRNQMTAEAITEKIDKIIVYFQNNLSRMKYATYQKAGYPIGSGVTEAACKVVAKQRLNGSGMRWNNEPVQHMLLLRGLVCTHGRWRQFWNFFDQQKL